MPAYIAGTPENEVTPSSANARSASAGSKRGTKSTRLPWWSAVPSTAPSPKMWLIGSGHQTCAPDPCGRCTVSEAATKVRLSCVSMTPFGVPVVPVV